MKAIFVAYNQAYNDEIALLVEQNGQRGYTLWQDIGGRGSYDGEPHLGSHAWPVQNHALLTVVDDSKVELIMDALRRKDSQYRDLGLRAWVLPVEQSL